LFLPVRRLYVTRCEVKHAARAKWRNWEWCMARVCNARYQRP
jgi:hypothetical protein